MEHLNNITRFEQVKSQTTEDYFQGNQFSVDAFVKKYALVESETYVQALKRVCDFIASAESTDELKTYWSERWFDEIYNDWWHPAGSIMQGAGSNRKISLANCTTISLGARREDEEWDNLESIVKNTAYTVSKCAAYRQGLGVDFSRLRPSGTKVLNSANESTGAVHWMQFIDKIGYYVGQCLHPSTPILTKSGILTIKEIVDSKFGGEIFGKNGKTPVINWFENGDKEVFEVLTEYGDIVMSSMDHKYLVYDEKTSAMCEKPLSDINVGDYIVSRRNNMTVDVDDVIIEFDKFEYQSSEYNNSNRLKSPSITPSQLTPSLSYILGIIYGDGCFTGEKIEIAFSNDWPEIMEKFNACMKEVFATDELTSYHEKIGTRGTSQGDCTIIILGKWFYKFFEFVGCKKGKSHNLIFPSILKRCDRLNLESFFSGVFDSDGYNSSDKKNISLIMSDYNFLFELKQQMQRFGYVFRLVEKIRDGLSPVYNLTSTGTRNSRYLLDIPSVKLSGGNISGKYDRLKTPYTAKSLNLKYNKYSDINADDFISDTKYEKYMGNVCDLYVQKVSKIESIGMSPTYDITVADPSHLFTVNSVIVSNSGRIPAMLFSIACDHPDVEEFIEVKSDYSKIQNANISVQCTEKFYKAVEKDSDWEMKFEVEGATKGDRVYVDVHSIDKNCHKEQGTGRWYKLATHDSKKEVFKKTVNARKLLELIAKNMHRNAEPGIQNIDIARKYSNSDALYNPEDEYDSRILSTNAPLVGETMIPTPHGIIPIRELYGKTEAIVLADSIVTLPSSLIDHNCEKSVWGKYNFPTKTFPVLARFKKYPDQIVWEIATNNGQIFKCNGDHKWLINGEMIATRDIKVGDKLFKPNGGIVQACDYSTNVSDANFNLGEVVGYIVGDGWVGKASDTHNTMIGILYDEDCRHYSDSFRMLYSEITGDFLTYERNRDKIFEVRTENSEFVKFFEKFGIVDSKYVIPKQCYTDLTFCAGFLRGLYQADGCVRWNGKQGQIVLTSVSEDIVGGVRDLLSNWFGIHSTLKTSTSSGVVYETKDGEQKISNCKDRYDLIISTREHLLRFRQYIGLLGKKGTVLSEIHNNCQQYNNRISLKIERVVETSHVEDMYCAEISGLHAFVVNGCISSNCSEQYLSRESLCVLASINVGRFSGKEEIYMSQLEKIGKSINRFLDNVNECELVHKTFATPHQELAIKKLRRTGAGVTNLAAWLFKKNLEYGSKEANVVVENFTKWYNYWLYISTEELGKEKGDFGLFEKNKWREAPFIMRCMEESVKLNSTYKVPIMKGTHARNVTVSSIAPTGTLSLMFRDFVMSYGIEPAFFIYFWKRTRITGEYKYYFCVPRIVRDKFNDAGIPIPMQSDTIEDDWDGKYGKPIAAFIDMHRDKFNFKESTDVKPLDKLEMMSKVMNWVDSSISVTYMLPINSTWEDVYEFIIEAHAKEVKSIAAFPDKKMYGIVSNISFKELAFKLKDEGVSIHHQNFTDIELKALNLSRENIEPASSFVPKRLPSLDADIYVLNVKGVKYCIVVGLQNDIPYEIFGGHLNGLGLKTNYKRGKITKVRKGQYALEFDDVSIDDFSKQFTPTEQILFRMASLQMRHGIPIRFIVEQLQRATDDITSMGSAAARVLKKYIVDGESVGGQKCPSCSKDLIYMDGCASCACGWSKCS